MIKVSFEPLLWLSPPDLSDDEENEIVSIQVSAPGWIISTAISLMKFMGKVRRIHLVVLYTNCQ
jgi:hypothetical protein